MIDWIGSGRGGVLFHGSSSVRLFLHVEHRGWSYGLFIAWAGCREYDGVLVYIGKYVSTRGIVYYYIIFNSILFVFLYLFESDFLLTDPAPQSVRPSIAQSYFVGFTTRVCTDMMDG